MSLKKPTKDYVFVIVQLLLFEVYFLPVHLLSTIALPVWLNYAGLIMLILAVVFGIMAFVQLNTNISPYPTPLESGKLVTNGVFRVARHPIYTSLIFSGFGYAIYQESIFKLFITLLLVILFYFKSKYEESLLTQKYPDYPEYKKRTRRFI